MNCPLYRLGCGGCCGLREPYGELLRAKHRRILRYFPQALPPIGMEAPLHYRHKVISTFAPSRGRLTSGIYAQGSHRVLPVHDCYLHDVRLDAVVRCVREILSDYGIPAYDEDRGTGVLRHLQLRKSHADGSVLVTLVCASETLPEGRRAAEAIRSACPDVAGVVFNYNPRKTSAVLGFRESVLAGTDHIEEVLCGCRFRISSRSFFQINPLQAEKLYSNAVALADLRSDSDVIDAYCGVGSLGIIAARKARKVVGLEFNGSAIRDAHVNAGFNGLENIRFIAGDAARLLADSGVRAQTVFLDPPREGCTPMMLEALARYGAPQIVYVSCNPETLSRDAVVLFRKGYRIRTVLPVDLFPYTEHVETICLLSKLSEAKHHISVQVDMDELDVTDAESKATYEEIQAWVQEKYGFHVTHLNIAKTKQKCGIIERQNYNLPKSEDSRSPETSKEKEEAIIDAFLHFKMM